MATLASASGRFIQQDSPVATTAIADSAITRGSSNFSVHPGSADRVPTAIRATDGLSDDGAVLSPTGELQQRENSVTMNGTGNTGGVATSLVAAALNDNGKPGLINNNNNNITSSHITNNNNNSAVPKVCSGCGGKIVDRFLLHAMERYWHTGCLKCSCCQAHLGEIGRSCFTKAGMILCKNDYIRMFGSSGTCAACAQPIPASEFVMRTQSRVYHVNCFTCVACHSRLVPGDRYGVVDGSLICEQDYPKVARGHTQVPLRSSHRVC